MAGVRGTAAPARLSGSVASESEPSIRTDHCMPADLVDNLRPNQGTQVASGLRRRCSAQRQGSPQFMSTVEHRLHDRLIHCAENSHPPLRRRELAAQGFRSPGGLQRVLSVFSAVRNLFAPPCSKRKQQTIAIHLHFLKAIVHWQALPMQKADPGISQRCPPADFTDITPTGPVIRVRWGSTLVCRELRPLRG